MLIHSSIVMHCVKSSRAHIHTDIQRLQYIIQSVRICLYVDYFQHPLTTPTLCLKRQSSGASEGRKVRTRTRLDLEIKMRLAGFPRSWKSPRSMFTSTLPQCSDSSQRDRDRDPTEDAAEEVNPLRINPPPLRGRRRLSYALTSHMGVSTWTRSN